MGHESLSDGLEVGKGEERSAELMVSPKCRPTHVDGVEDHQLGDS